MIHIQENNDRFVIQFPVDRGKLNYKSIIVLLDVNYRDRQYTHKRKIVYLAGLSLFHWDNDMSIIVDKMAHPHPMRGFLCVQPYPYLQIHTYYKVHEKN